MTDQIDRSILEENYIVNNTQIETYLLRVLVNRACLLVGAEAGFVVTFSWANDFRAKQRATGLAIPVKAVYIGDLRSLKDRARGTFYGKPRSAWKNRPCVYVNGGRITICLSRCKGLDIIDSKRTTMAQEFVEQLWEVILHEVTHIRDFQLKAAKEWTPEPPPNGRKKWDYGKDPMELRARESEKRFGLDSDLEMPDVRGTLEDVANWYLDFNDAQVRAAKRVPHCSDCRDGEHDNYDDDIMLVTVKDPETGKLVKRSNMCRDHRIMYLDDGYVLYHNGQRM